MSGLRGDQIALYLKDMYKAEREGYQEMETKYDKIFKIKTGVKGAGDKVVQVLGAGTLSRHSVEGQSINYKSPVSGWEYLVKYWTYSDGIALSKEAVEDTVKLGNLLKELSSTWGKQVRVTKETFGARVFNEGGNLSGDWIFNGSHTGNTASYGDMFYDNEPLFNLTGNARSTKGGGTYYNSVASLTLTPPNFETLYNLHTSTNNRDERDQIVRNPCDTILTRPGANRFLADRLLGTTGMPSSELNDVNPYYKLLTPIDWDYLESAEGNFYVGKRQSESFQFHERQASEIRFFRDETNLSYKTSINIRIGVLLKDWRAWSRAGGTSV